MFLHLEGLKGWRPFRRGVVLNRLGGEPSVTSCYDRKFRWLLTFSFGSPPRGTLRDTLKFVTGCRC